MSPDDGRAFRQLAEENNIPNRPEIKYDAEIHPGRKGHWSDEPHINIGRYHIPIVGPAILKCGNLYVPLAMPLDPFIDLNNR